MKVKEKDLVQIQWNGETGIFQVQFGCFIGDVDCHYIVLPSYATFDIDNNKIYNIGKCTIKNTQPFKDNYYRGDLIGFSLKDDTKNTEELPKIIKKIEIYDKENDNG